MNGYQMIASEHGLVKQGIRKRIVLLYAKGILLFLPWEVVLCAPMKKRKELMTAHNKCGSVDLFFNNPCSSGISKAQRKTGAVKEMLTKNDVTIAEIMWLAGISATIPAVTLLIYSSVCFQTVK